MYRKIYILKKGEKTVCEKLPPKEHDTTFKFLFADKEEILLLVKDILHYTWADNIEEDTIELVKTNYVTQQFSQVEADVVAKAKLKDKEVYFYILIENQSKVKREMQQKILKYMISLWAEEIRKGVQILPAIIPIVVYNGIGERWNVSTDLMEAFDVFREWKLWVSLYQMLQDFWMRQRQKIFWQVNLKQQSSLRKG